MTEHRTSQPQSWDEADWERIADNDEVWAPPTHLPPSLANPAPALLNTHEMEWKTFERLVLAMARQLDGAYDARRYGREGQAQHGLDVVAFFHHRKPSVYQAKRREAFRPSDLEEAVDRYAKGRRPFDADRVVVAVGREARETEVLNKLAALREKYSDMTIDLWDRQSISEQLRDKPEIVATFFGRATAAAFCPNGPLPATPIAAASVAADAILRGPVAHLGLAEDLRHAQVMVENKPEEAAGLFERIANSLETAGYVPHSVPIRESQATALQMAGRRAEEAWVRIDLAWRQFDGGDMTSATTQVQIIDQWRADTTEEVRRCKAVLEIAIRLRRNYGVLLDHLAQAFDALGVDDRHRVDAGPELAEEAVAHRMPEIVNARSALFLDLASSLTLDSTGQLKAARLRMCVADASAAWEELASTARDTYPPAVAALVLARHARYLTLIPKAEPSASRWRDAIERAVMEGCNDDASAWLYALRTMRVQTGLIGVVDDLNELHRHALALRAAGGGTVLPAPYDARERALSSLQRADWLRALEALNHYLWRSTVIADWYGEIDAHDLLGDLFLKMNRGAEAVRHYVMAGEAKKLSELGDNLRDEPIDLPIGLLTNRPWEQAAAFTFASACADLVVDDDAREWCAAALTVLVERQNDPTLFFAPNPWLAAFKAFGRLSIVSTLQEARTFLEMSRSLIPREAGHYRFSDEAQVHALIGIAHAHPELREKAVGQLLDALLVDQRMARLVLTDAQELLRTAPDISLAAAEEQATAGNYFATLALVACGRDSPSVLRLARERLTRALAPRDHQAGVIAFGTDLAHTAGLVRLLPEHDRVGFARAMVEFARDRQEPNQNRHEALMALQVIATYVPDAVRTELFEGIVPFIEGREDGSLVDKLLGGANDPLQRVRVSLGSSSLVPGGLIAAAALAQSDNEYSTVENCCTAALRGADEEMCNAIAIALAALPVEKVTLSVRLLASHPSQWLRALAATHWARRPDEPVEVGIDLSQDESPHVRGVLASAIGDGSSVAVLRGILSHDTRRSIRRHVSGTEPPASEASEAGH